MRLFIRPRTAFRAAGRYRSPRSMHRRCATRNSFSARPREGVLEIHDQQLDRTKMSIPRLRKREGKKSSFAIVWHRYFGRNAGISRLSTRSSLRVACAGLTVLSYFTLTRYAAYNSANSGYQICIRHSFRQIAILYLFGIPRVHVYVRFFRPYSKYVIALPREEQFFFLSCTATWR